MPGDRTLDPELAAVLDVLAGMPPLWQEEPAVARAGYRALSVDGRDPATLPPIASVDDITVPGAAGDVPARVYRPATAAALPTIVMFHGGGWVIGDLDTHDIEGRNLANLCEAVVVAVDYRLAPEDPFPAAYDDAVAAARWIADHEAGFGRSGRIAVAGDSAGGNLAAGVAQVFRDEGRPLAAQLLVYPSTDKATVHPSRVANGEGYFLDEQTIQWFLKQYAPDVDATDPRLSPRYGDLTGLPPAVVVTAEFDPLRDDGAAYAAALAEAGVPVVHHDFPGLIHGFITMGRQSRAAQAAIETAYADFRALLHG